MRTFIGFACLCIFVSACNLPVTTPQADPAGAAPTSALGRCGDGVCGRPENGDACYSDCQRLTDQDQAQALVRDEAPAIEDAVPPLYVLYVIHTHAQGDHLPYADPGLTQIDTAVASNVASAMAAIAETLNRHEVKGTWEVVYGTAQGLCSWPDSQNLMQSLIDQGHEIGVHAHSTTDIPVAARTIRDICGIQPRTVSGFMI